MPRIEKFDFDVEGSPEVVSERLRQRTRTQWMPSQGRMIRLGETPFAGIVRGDRFTIALNEPDPWRRLRATATGSLLPSPVGTRVSGQAGVPGFWTWYLRTAYAFSIFIALVGGAATLAGGAHSVLTAFVSVMGVILFVLTYAVDAQVRNADRQAQVLAEALRRNLGAGVWPMKAGGEAMEASNQQARAPDSQDGDSPGASVDPS